MRKHLNTKTSKEFERQELLKLEGHEVFGVAKFTNGKTYQSNKVLKLLTEVKIYKPDGSALEVNHLYVPLENNKKTEIIWAKHLGSYRKFQAKITSYGFEEKKASLELDIEKNVWKFGK